MATVTEDGDPAQGGGAAVIAACVTHLSLYKEPWKCGSVPLLFLRGSSRSFHFMWGAGAPRGFHSNFGSIPRAK